jgi:hypothetical protein
MSFELDDIVPSNKFFKGLFYGFFLSLIFWAALIAVLLIGFPPVEPPLADTIHIDAPAPNDH